ncbi:MAG TPA: AmmeMemoRadiSam system protein B [Chloroflexi bacterium]|nr:AmmeMemoRadiSam system protein B [Chloroflexota bacterium]
MNPLIRPPAVAGTFYPATPSKLKSLLATQLEAADPPALSGVRALILPHAGYVYSGPVAAFGYRLLSTQLEQIERVYLLGPAHRIWFPGVALGDYDAFQTPLGMVRVDRECIAALANAEDFFIPMVQAHEGEHCLEVQLPFLQYIGLDAPIVPLLFGEVHPQQVGRALATQLTPHDLVIVSSDLSHYYADEIARRLDQGFLTAVLEGDKLQVSEGEACGQCPIIALMTLAERWGWQPQLLDYRTSGDTAGDRRQVVGYAAIAYVEGADG